MKNAFGAIVLSLLMLTSCMTTKVSVKNDYNFDVMCQNLDYTLERKDGSKIREFEFTKQDGMTLFGKVDGKEMSVQKAELNKVSKISAGKTLGIVLGAAAVAVLVSAYAKNEPVGGR